MRIKNTSGLIEIILGMGLILFGFYIHSWAKSLYWILIYPPPREKQIIEATPFFLWIVGTFLIVGGIRRVIINV